MGVGGGGGGGGGGGTLWVPKVCQGLDEWWLEEPEAEALPPPPEGWAVLHISHRGIRLLLAYVQVGHDHWDEDMV